METKHTLGPWEHAPAHGTNLGGFKAANGGWVCTFGDCETNYHDAGNPPEPADARLIAAAPELLEALQEVIAISDRKHDVWDKAKAAIAKATGAV